MKRILEYLANDGSFLYELCECHIVHSEYISSFGGTGSITLKSDPLEINLWLERDKLFVDFRSVHSKSEHSWYSIDIIRTFISGELCRDAILNADNSNYLKSHFHEISEMFSLSNIKNTEKECNRLETLRSQRMFGN